MITSMNENEITFQWKDAIHVMMIMLQLRWWESLILVTPSHKLLGETTAATFFWAPARNDNGERCKRRYTCMFQSLIHLHGYYLGVMLCFSLFVL